MDIRQTKIIFTIDIISFHKTNGHSVFVFYLALVAILPLVAGLDLAERTPRCTLDTSKLEVITSDGLTGICVSTLKPVQTRTSQIVAISWWRNESLSPDRKII